MKFSSGVGQVETVIFTAMRWIDLNADLGEGGLEDAVLLEFASSVNIACGGHVGDRETMRQAVDLAAAAGVKIGAHPSYEDPEHFGRRALTLPLAEVTESVVRQLGNLAAMVSAAGKTLHHVRPHGALYHQAGRDFLLATAVVEGIVHISSELILYAQPQSALAEAGRLAGLRVWGEGIADRNYRDDGSLMPRGEPNGVIKDLDAAVAQAVRLSQNERIDTICVHGDGTNAVTLLRAIREVMR
jgi:5-oxoprolinase (ATP-hydrolysing) subunit A